MNKKTLYIDAPLIQFAHAYSQQTYQSISHLIEKVLQRLRAGIRPVELSPQTKALHGILRGENIPDQKGML